MVAQRREQREPGCSLHRTGSSPVRPFQDGNSCSPRYKPRFPAPSQALLPGPPRLRRSRSSRSDPPGQRPFSTARKDPASGSR